MTCKLVKPVKICSFSSLILLPEKLISFKDKKQYPFTFLKLNTPFSAIDIASIPTTYLVNTKGEIVYNKVGYIHWDDESNLNHLKTLME